MAPMTIASPSREIPDMPATWRRSTRWAGAARRCFIVGNRVWPPASSLASSLPRAATASATLVGAEYSKLCMELLQIRGGGAKRAAGLLGRLLRLALLHRLPDGG